MRDVSLSTQVRAIPGFAAKVVFQLPVSVGRDNRVTSVAIEIESLGTNSLSNLEPIIVTEGNSPSVFFPRLESNFTDTSDANGTKIYEPVVVTLSFWMIAGTDPTFSTRTNIEYIPIRSGEVEVENQTGTQAEIGDTTVAAINCDDNPEPSPEECMNNPTILWVLVLMTLLSFCCWPLLLLLCCWRRRRDDEEEEEEEEAEKSMYGIPIDEDTKKQNRFSQQWFPRLPSIHRKSIALKDDDNVGETVSDPKEVPFKNYRRPTAFSIDELSEDPSTSEEDKTMETGNYDNFGKDDPDDISDKDYAEPSAMELYKRAKKDKRATVYCPDADTEFAIAVDALAEQSDTEEPEGRTYVLATDVNVFKDGASTENKEIGEQEQPEIENPDLAPNNDEIPDIPDLNAIECIGYEMMAGEDDQVVVGAESDEGDDESEDDNSNEHDDTIRQDVTLGARAPPELEDSDGSDEDETPEEKQRRISNVFIRDTYRRLKEKLDAEP